MAGLVAAARLRELGAETIVLEKGTRAGGSMLLSSCVVWRHREWEDFRTECPDGEEPLQRAVWERLDDGIAWLESLCAPVVWHETGNPRTDGKRFDPGGLTDTLVRAAGDVRLERDARAHLRRHESTAATILCTGGFQGNPELVARHIRPRGSLRLRANPWSTGDGLTLGRERGAGLSSGMDEFYGRNMPDCDFDEPDFVRLAQLYGRFARAYNERGEQFFRGEVSWSENDLAQATARQPNARAWYVLDDDALGRRVRERTVAEIVASAPTATDPAALPFPVAPDARVAVRVSPGITHTIGGLRIDDHARVLDEEGRPVEGLFAAGVDAGGIAAGGYASGLAGALVFGRIAAESAFAGR